MLASSWIDGAILDVNLVDRDITPVVALLTERGVPIILQSGVGLPPELSARFPQLTVHIKPCSPMRLIEELAQMLLGSAAATLTLSVSEQAPEKSTR